MRATRFTLGVIISAIPVALAIGGARVFVGDRLQNSISRWCR